MMNTTDEFFLTTPNLLLFESNDCPKTYEELEALIRFSNAVDAKRSFQNLKVALLKAARHQSSDFYVSLLPFLWSWAREKSKTIMARQLCDGPDVVILTQSECLAILANAFFCTFSSRRSDNCISGPRLPSINFDELYGGYGSQSVARAKICLLLEYFLRQSERVATGDRLLRPVSFDRCQAVAGTAEDWIACRQPLLTPTVMTEETPLDEARHAVRVDFANSIIGGAAVAYGCVQEEIMFCVNPELICSRLYFPQLRDDEAVLIRGTEQFSVAQDYGLDLGFDGRFEDPSSIDGNGMLDSTILAVDAFDMRNHPPEFQYTSRIVLRELNKMWAGLTSIKNQTEVATGNWGCGVFEGDVELKFLIQWLAISRGQMNMLYFPYHESRISKGAIPIIDALIRADISIGDCAKWLLEELRPGPVFNQLLEKWGM